NADANVPGCAPHRTGETNERLTATISSNTGDTNCQTKSYLLHYRLAYASAREDAGGRARRRAERIRERLGWEPGILNGHGPKPKGMRWRTFHRLIEEHDRLVNRSLHAVALKFGFLDRLLSE
ncbi:MAG: hypothetical protein AB1773_16050, partial [Pseudomonadota bacterium]